MTGPFKQDDFANVEFKTFDRKQIAEIANEKFAELIRPLRNAVKKRKWVRASTIEKMIDEMKPAIPGRALIPETE